MSISDCSLYLEVWDADTFGGGSFLGSVKISDSPLKGVVENRCVQYAVCCLLYASTFLHSPLHSPSSHPNSRFLPRWYPLVPSEYLSPKIQSLVGGEIEIRLGYCGAQEAAQSTLQKFELRVLGAAGLARADGIFGLSDPYALVKVSEGCYVRCVLCAHLTQPHLP